MAKALLTSSWTTSTLPKLAALPVEARVLVTAILTVLAIGMLGAVGQIIVHDIIPTFIENNSIGLHGQSAGNITEEETVKSRGDLFGDLSAEPVSTPSNNNAINRQEQFIWLLKWTHIHLFGMSMIFIFVGGITVLLDLATAAKAWLVALPFFGVLVDIMAMWLKAYGSPAFFWLHLPGGVLFSGIFLFVLTRALLEMWGTKRVANEN